MRLWEELLLMVSLQTFQKMLYTVNCFKMYDYAEYAASMGKNSNEYNRNDFEDHHGTTLHFL